MDRQLTIAQLEVYQSIIKRRMADGRDCTQEQQEFKLGYERIRHEEGHIPHHITDFYYDLIGIPSKKYYQGVSKDATRSN